VLTRLEIRNFQSLARVDVPLGPFTVVTGTNGAGKSAIFRALQTLACNARGTGYITHGRATCSVAAGDGRTLVAITRSRTRGRDSYQLARLVSTPVAGGSGWTAVKYTKLAGQVPPQVTEALGLSELNFAGQWDSPYLLTLSGAALAQTLGELTNVSLVLSAAAEASRRRKRFDRDLETALKRRDALLAQAREFAGLAERRRALRRAEEALGRLQATSAALERLRSLTGRLRAARAAADAARAEAARREPPSLERLEQLARRHARLRELSARLEAARADAARFSAAATQAGLDEQAARDGLHAALKACGQCPVCGSAVT
jgi:DNA repair exonuclease SbcCD ATPase subunit